ncbi:hypothetical protein PIROE2DRAFT_63517 [Piromyces sp. E2]|nr:hypothetical protein PIROE2DRAFT_63517 [Piromyces sp. E2]|eukprot:OUM59830.1 hypothetical protein PIROE2DRAFT_63517 [Piromyces sp. E2]
MDKYTFFNLINILRDEKNVNHYYYGYKKMIKEIIDSGNDWNKNNPNASVEDYNEKILELKNLMEPIDQIIEENNVYKEEEIKSKNNLYNYISEQLSFLKNYEKDILTFYINFKNKLIYDINKFIENKEKYISEIENNMNIIYQINVIFKTYNFNQSYKILNEIQNIINKIKEKEENNKIKKYYYNLFQILNNKNVSNSIFENFRRILMYEIEKCNNWFNDNPLAKKEEYDSMKIKIENTMKPLYQIKEASEKYKEIFRKETYKNCSNNSSELNKIYKEYIDKIKWYQENPNASINDFKKEEINIANKLFFLANKIAKR